MLGKNTGKHVQADVPEGWDVQYHTGRMQPYTLRLRGTPHDRHLGTYATIRFCYTLAEAQRVSTLPLNISLSDLRQAAGC